MAYLVELLYKATHREMKEVPYKYKYPLWAYFYKPIRKWMIAVVIPTIPFNGIRILLYRINGIKIGKKCFIGMRCYLDDFCYDKIEIGNNVTISYGVYFACHGRKQGHNKVIIKDGAYIGMHCNIIAPQEIIIGENAIIGAASLINRSVAPGSTVVGVPGKPVVKN